MNIQTTPIKKSLGIVSGAGPMAGVVLMQKIIELYQQQGSWKDADFPLIRLLNYPFSDMLSDDYDIQAIQKELLMCLNELSASCDYVLISCQTLHAFLPKNYNNPKLLDFFGIIQASLPPGPIWVAASYTSSQKQLHSVKLNRDCFYLNPKKCQSKIDSILKGEQTDMSWLEKKAESQPLLLGCTEFSIPFHNKKTPCIDPYDSLVPKIADLLSGLAA